ncbi:MAG TPA: hypothetical protein VM890_12000 [Longimicrobium sp.]|nr:hypothetical protein [Longimicrobium sp.]
MSVPSVSRWPTSDAVPGCSRGSATDPAGSTSRSATCGTPARGAATTRSPFASA